MSKSATKPSAARQRIIETAERLFYSEGIRAVGIDRIIAEANVAKMTLYNHFASKDDLILAVLKYREAKFDTLLEQWIQEHINDGMNRLEAFFAALKDWFESPGFRGCAFINASVELADAAHPASQFSTEHKSRFQAKLTEIVAESAGASAVAAVPGIALMIEGAIVTAVMNKNSQPADTAKAAAFELISQVTSA